MGTRVKVVNDHHKDTKRVHFTHEWSISTVPNYVNLTNFNTDRKTFVNHLQWSALVSTSSFSRNIL